LTYPLLLLLVYQDQDQYAMEMQLY